MIITKATKEDLSEILQLQYLSYQSEAKLLNNFDIPPLKQTLQEVQNEYDNGTILKVLDDNNRIIGSVRGYIEMVLYTLENYSYTHFGKEKG